MDAITIKPQPDGRYAVVRKAWGLSFRLSIRGTDLSFRFWPRPTDKASWTTARKAQLALDSYLRANL